MTNPQTSHQVTGGGGCKLSVYSAGPEDGALVVALHGIGQTALAWSQLSDIADEKRWRVVSVDLRGHGDSEKPEGAYGASDLWADDVAAVLKDAGASKDRKATLLGWSYGGAVLTDYLAKYGAGLVHAIVTLGATDKLGAPVGPFVQPGFGALTKAIMTDDSGAVAADLLDMCTTKPLPAARREELLAGALKCPAHVRNSMMRRTLDNDEALAAFKGRALITHGTSDQMFTIELGEHLAKTVERSTFSKYEGVGHMPLWEDPPKFIAELTEIVAGQ